jgi:hypothetical protein
MAREVGQPLVLAGEVTLNPWSPYGTKTIGRPMRTWVKFLFWNLSTEKRLHRRVICYTRPRRQPEVHPMLIHVFHSGAIPGSTSYFGYTLKRVPTDLPTMQTRPWKKKFGGPIEVMPGERRAGITEDVLAEIGYSL